MELQPLGLVLLGDQDVAAVRHEVHLDLSERDGPAQCDAMQADLWQLLLEDGPGGEDVPDAVRLRELPLQLLQRHAVVAENLVQEEARQLLANDIARAHGQGARSSARPVHELHVIHAEAILLGSTLGDHVGHGHQRASREPPPQLRHLRREARPKVPEEVPPGAAMVFSDLADELHCEGPPQLLRGHLPEAGDGSADEARALHLEHRLSKLLFRGQKLPAYLHPLLQRLVHVQELEQGSAVQELVVHGAVGRLAPMLARALQQRLQTAHHELRQLRPLPSKQRRDGG
mmetsp:Transcript_41798/g.120757  ORF Transcript_41798/g.120757 Transcript_41798/m.120757 type:complete len:288 (+) Transcript_41798:584-1447(+)